MSNISYDRVVDVNVEISDRFATVASFGTPLIIDADAAGETTLAVDSVKSFSSLADMVAYGFTVTSPAYLTASAMLSVNNAPKTFKVGYFVTDLITSLTAVDAKDSEYYAVVLATEQQPGDAAALIAANAFLIDNSKILFFQSNDTALRDDSTDTTGLGAQLRVVQPSRLVGFYFDKLDANGAAIAPADQMQYHAKAAAFVSTVDYNEPASHYTLKFKRLDGATPSLLSDIQAQNLTGFLPRTGLDPNVGGHLNIYICTAGLNFVVEGVATDGGFVDLITFSDWLVATLQANILSVYTNNRVIPYDLTGVAILSSAVLSALNQAVISGAATEGRTDSNGDLLDPYEIKVQDIADVPAALQAQRIAPTIEYCIRYGNAVHYALVTGTIKVAN